MAEVSLGILVTVGWQTRIAAFGFIAFTVVATLISHNLLGHDRRGARTRPPPHRREMRGRSDRSGAWFNRRSTVRSPIWVDAPTGMSKPRDLRLRERDAYGVLARAGALFGGEVARNARHPKSAGGSSKVAGLEQGEVRINTDSIGKLINQARPDDICRSQPPRAMLGR